MGSLRLEPKRKPLVTREQYENYASILREAQGAARENEIFWDLEEGEKASRVRKEFLYVAKSEGIQVIIRQLRKTNSLAFKFTGEVKERTRISAKESKKRILTSLVAANKPLRKSEIIKYAGISPSTWNLRIRELLQEGSVKREGDRRDSVYSIA